MISIDPANDETLETLLAEAKWNNREATRLFRNESESLLQNRLSQVMNSNSGRSNIGWIDTHLCHIESKLDEVDGKLLNWKKLHDAFKVASIENVTTRSLFFEEKRQTTSLFYSFNDLISTKQSQDAQLHDLNLKYLALQKQHQEALSLKIEKDKLYDSSNIEYERDFKEVKENLRAKAKGSTDSQDVKRRKLSSSKSSNCSTAVSNEGARSILDGTQLTIATKNSTAKAPTSYVPSLTLKHCKSSSVKVIAQPGFVKEDSSTKEKLSEIKESFIGRQVERKFPGHGLFVGTVKSYKAPYYTICYDDGDQEDMNVNQMKKWLLNN